MPRVFPVTFLPRRAVVKLDRKVAAPRESHITYAASYTLQDWARWQLWGITSSIPIPQRLLPFDPPNYTSAPIE